MKNNLGQVFLINKNIAEKIVNLLNINSEDCVFEAGSGKGILSNFLLKTNYKLLILNDIDNNLIKKIQKMINNKKNTYVIKKSALKVNIINFNKIISNLPYYLTSSLIEYFLTKSNAIKYVFMVQKEFFNRINASINSKYYGPLNVLINCIGIMKKELTVFKENFYPIPKINSIVFSITSNKQEIKNKSNFFIFLKKMFSHRRKTIYNNLFFYLKDEKKIKPLLQKLKIPFYLRPQQIAPLNYLKIFNILEK